MIRRALTLAACAVGLASAWPAVASADNGNLWLYGTAATGDTGQPVLGGTGPGITGLSTTGGYETAWQGPDGVLVMMDLGSAVLSADMAMEFLDPDLAARARTDVTVAGVALDRIVVDTVPRGVDTAADLETARRILSKS